VIHHDTSLFLQSRNLIVLGKNSKLTLVHCDDSYNQQPAFSNIVTEIVAGEGAFMDHYKLQSLNNDSALVSGTFFHLEQEAGLESHFITLNGGLIRNNIHVELAGRHAHADLYGIYLMDRKQHVDNQVYIDHHSSDCTSSTHFKGVMDEQATGVFNGHVLVRRDAARTSAYQSNRNILLTESARVFSKPFLEIYNDDVKCSHGSTTGQLDPIEDMVKKRLQGELQICEQCVLHCTTPEKPVEFEMDLGRV